MSPRRDRFQRALAAHFPHHGVNVVDVVDGAASVEWVTAVLTGSDGYKFGCTLTLPQSDASRDAAALDVAVKYFQECIDGDKGPRL